VSFVLDTDICSAFLKGDGRVFNRFIQHSGGLYVSAITSGELYSWVSRARKAPRHPAAIIDMLSGVTTLAVDHDIALRFGQEGARLLDQGISMSPTDPFIAATALDNDFSLVTHNSRDFRKVPGLRLEDWIASAP
jgi:tRNA(fMet)-specific endonuclease VapC